MALSSSCKQGYKSERESSRISDDRRMKCIADEEEMSGSINRAHEQESDYAGGGNDREDAEVRRGGGEDMLVDDPPQPDGSRDHRQPSPVPPPAGVVTVSPCCGVGDPTYRDHANDTEEDVLRLREKMVLSRQVSGEEGGCDDCDAPEDEQQRGGKRNGDDVLSSTKMTKKGRCRRRKKRYSCNYRGGVSDPFPFKLHRMLEDAELGGLTDVVAWRRHGRAFMVHEPKAFVSKIMPKYFKQTKITSFQRQLNLYGFHRLTRGVDTGSYYHELFLRGRSHLCCGMIRTKVKGTGHFKAQQQVPSRSGGHPALADCEPNLYAMPSLPMLDIKRLKKQRCAKEEAHLSEEQCRANGSEDQTRCKDSIAAPPPGNSTRAGEGSTKESEEKEAEQDDSIFDNADVPTPFDPPCVLVSKQPPGEASCSEPPPAAANDLGSPKTLRTMLTKPHCRLNVPSSICRVTNARPGDLPSSASAFEPIPLKHIIADFPLLSQEPVPLDRNPGTTATGTENPRPGEEPPVGSGPEPVPLKRLSTWPAELPAEELPLAAMTSGAPAAMRNLPLSSAIPEMMYPPRRRQVLPPLIESGRLRPTRESMWNLPSRECALAFLSSGVVAPAAGSIGDGSEKASSRGKKFGLTNSAPINVAAAQSIRQKLRAHDWIGSNEAARLVSSPVRGPHGSGGEVEEALPIVTPEARGGRERQLADRFTVDAPPSSALPPPLLERAKQRWLSLDRCTFCDVFDPSPPSAISASSGEPGSSSSAPTPPPPPLFEPMPPPETGPGREDAGPGTLADKSPVDRQRKWGRQKGPERATPERAPASSESGEDEPDDLLWFCGALACSPLPHTADGLDEFVPDADVAAEAVDRCAGDDAGFGCLLENLVDSTSA